MATLALLLTAHIGLAAPEHVHVSSTLVAARYVHAAGPDAGAGIAAEHVFADGTGVEVTVGAPNGGATGAIPVELLVSHTWHVAEAMEAYAGLGPIVSATPHDGRLTSDWGAVGALGSHVWFGAHLGLLAEVDVTVAPGTAPHTEFIAGPVFRWDSRPASPASSP
jgi:hypothetical protein